MSKRFTHRKRSAGGSTEPEYDEGIELTDLRAQVETLTVEKEALITPFKHSGCFNMKVHGDRRRLAESLYAGNYAASIALLREQNAELVTVLKAQLANQSTVTEHLVLSRERMVDGILLDICRAQNQNVIPVLTAAMSILGEVNHVSREYHDALALYHRGAASSEKWVRDFLVEAREWRPPPPPDALIDGVAVAVFDNLTMNVDYKSYSCNGETGHKLDMTNWLSTRVPRSLAPTLDARSECTPGARNRTDCCCCSCACCCCACSAWRPARGHTSQTPGLSWLCLCVPTRLAS